MEEGKSVISPLLIISKQRLMPCLYADVCVCVQRKSQQTALAFKIIAFSLLAERRDLSSIAPKNHLKNSVDLADTEQMVTKKKQKKKTWIRQDKGHKQMPFSEYSWVRKLMMMHAETSAQVHEKKKKKIIHQLPLKQRQAHCAHRGGDEGTLDKTRRFSCLIEIEIDKVRTNRCESRREREKIDLRRRKKRTLSLQYFSLLLSFLLSSRR